MTTDNARWTDDPALVLVRGETTLEPRDEDVARRLVIVTDAWAAYRETGDRQALVNLGILPEQEA